jgi:SAM-dependent methyltransferase
MSEPTVVDALTQLANGEWHAAAEAARRAASAQRDSRLADALAHFLAEMTGPGVYDEPRAFETFISHGGNVELYRRTIEQLAALHGELQSRAVLDIGCGDGRVTAGALQPSTTRVDLVEPSSALLASAVAALDRPGLEVVPHHLDVSTYLGGLDDTVTWDVVQSTFALHATDPAERPALFRSLARRTARLVIVEFDIPAFADRSAAHIAYLAERYERGVREYRDHPDVIGGFLMPVLVGQLDPAAARYTYEQPAAAWVTLAEDAGFVTSIERVADYWWGDAVLICGQSATKN